MANIFIRLSPNPFHRKPSEFNITGDQVSSFPYKLKEIDIESNTLTKYVHSISEAVKALESSVTPHLEPIFEQLSDYSEIIMKQEMDINYNNPMIHTNKTLYVLYMLLIEQSNQFWRAEFDRTEKKIIVLPRCLTGPDFNLLKVKRTKIGWHKIIGTQDTNFNAWMLNQVSIDNDFEVYITMGNRFKEPNFLRVFRNLRKKYGHFSLIPIACIPELALGNTYVMEMGIPSHAVPIFYSGCAKWHGSSAIRTEFPLTYVLELLSLNH
ncbi:hypothetical protein CEE45_01790 [Candidatus Heimdallarchaeota archaeon B3_Heim]|nr:MAG: hypothetical protein CEE45_01790 [Candidatus Heimdallarchaeota archaeon B3_Heim]